MRYLLGLDIGTSGTKVALFDELGNTISTATYGYDLYQAQVGWAEQKPEEWWNACVNGIKDVITNSEVDSEDIKGIGLSGQMHGLVLLDENNEVIRPSILWLDQRLAEGKRKLPLLNRFLFICFFLRQVLVLQQLRHFTNV